MSNNVYIAHTAADCSEVREELGQILKNAGMNVLPRAEFKSFSETTALAELSEANCSVHILGGEVGEKTSLGIPQSLYQIQEAIKQIGHKPGFRVFIWHVAQTKGFNISPEQLTLINNIRNNIVNNVVFTNVPSPVQLVDDIRAMLQIKIDVEDSGPKKPIFLMYNFIDEEQAEEVRDMLSDIIDVESLIIGEHPDMDYGSVSVRIIRNSELAVVFYSEANHWAMPFIQQIWKMTGGASSKTPLLMIGDEDGGESPGFNAPNVINKKVSLNLVPLEIKVAYDKVVNG